MIKPIFGAQVIVLVLGWVMVAASIVGPGSDSGALWPVGFFLALTLSLVLVRQLPAEPPARRPPGSGPTNWADAFAETPVGKIVYLLLALVLAAGSGGVAGVLVCVPVQGVAEAIAGFPETLGTAIAGAAMSVMGFGLLVLVMARRGPPLFAAWEAWIGYVSPVVGGVVGAAVRSGTLSGGIGIVGVSAWVGALGLLGFDLSAGGKRVGTKHVGESLVAGIGFGVINGVILAVLFCLWGPLG